MPHSAVSEWNVPLPPQPLTVQDLAQQRRARRLTTYEQVWVLRRQGRSGKGIARQLGIGKSTVFRYLRTTTFPERKRRSDRGQRSVLTPYKDYLLTRWKAGSCEALRLFKEIQQQGYTGSYSPVARYTRRLRQAQGLALREYSPAGARPAVAEPTKRQLTARRAAWLGW
jgi:transposase